MPSLPASRTTRRLFKLASLGLAGLLAGLLSGCNASPQTASQTASQTQSDTSVSTESPSSDFYSLHRSLDMTQIPSLRHPPSARRLDYGSLHLSHASLSPTFPYHS
jgi:hypothetical protein